MNEKMKFILQVVKNRSKHFVRKWTSHDAQLFYIGIIAGALCTYIIRLPEKEECDFLYSPPVVTQVPDIGVNNGN